MSRTGRSKRAKSRRSAKVDGFKGKNWTVFCNKTGPSKGSKLDGHFESKWTVLWSILEWKWTVFEDESERFQGSKPNDIFIGLMTRRPYSLRPRDCLLDVYDMTDNNSKRSYRSSPKRPYTFNHGLYTYRHRP